MRHFTELCEALEIARSADRKLGLLRGYFRSAPPSDAAWALYLLSGERLRRGASSALLRSWCAEETGLPSWLVDECHEHVGDLAEALALLLPDRPGAVSESLSGVLSRCVLPLPGLPEGEKRERIRDLWSRGSAGERRIALKLLTGGFRIGVARGTVLRAVALEFGSDPAVLAHRLMGGWSPSAEAWDALRTGEEPGSGPGRPYPFLLAHSFEGLIERLEPPEEWAVEWKWDGARAQLIRRSGGTLLWSRGEELLSGSFPELVQSALWLPEGSVLDGEIVVMEPGTDRPRGFRDLQRRLNRKRPGPGLLRELPAMLIAWDLLEEGGVDLRARPLGERRARLEGLLEEPGIPGIRISPIFLPRSSGDFAALRDRAAEVGAEGIMIKHLQGPYPGGRPKGNWWKWKLDPFRVDAVLLYARHGHGRRAGLLTDFTLGVWDEGTLVPLASAYSGLTESELREIDRWIRRNTVERFGPVRSVQPGLVFEVAFEGIQPSTRHRSGLAVRFPRLARWRKDLSPEQADTLQSVRSLAEGLRPGRA